MDFFIFFFIFFYQRVKLNLATKSRLRNNHQNLIDAISSLRSSPASKLGENQLICSVSSIKPWKKSSNKQHLCVWVLVPFSNIFVFETPVWSPYTQIYISRDDLFFDIKDFLPGSSAPVHRVQFTLQARFTFLVKNQ